MYSFLNISEAIEYNLEQEEIIFIFQAHPKSGDILSDLALDSSVSTIIYVQTRKSCEQIQSLIQGKNMKCLKYHGGMSIEEKKENHENLFRMR